jgi:hypothetical protein
MGKQNFISLLKNISVRTSFIFLAESLNKRLSQMKLIIFFLESLPFASHKNLVSFTKQNTN